MINEVKIKGSNNNSINGIYKVQTLRNVDKNTKSYYNDEQYQLYRYKNKWRIAHNGEKVYIELSFCEGKEWDIGELDLTNIEELVEELDLTNIDDFTSPILVEELDLTNIDDFTLFDVFWKNNLIYLILSINNNILDENKLNVYLNKKKLKLKQKIIKDTYEPTLLFIYDDNNVDINKELFIQVIYDKKEYSKEIEKIINKKN